MNAKTRSIAIAAALVLMGVFSILLQAQSRQVNERREGNRSTGQTTRAFVSTVTDAPVALQLAQPASTGVDPQDPAIQLVITNTTDKAVSAYAIKYEVFSNGRLHPGGVELTNIIEARALLQPRETRTANIGGVHYSLPIERIVVSIDFLEFTDDTTWGVDTFSSAETLAGMRAGAKTATEHLLRLLTTQGPTTFAGELEAITQEVSMPIGHSTKWQEGFQRGMAFITERTKRKTKGASAAEIEKALALPIDARDEINRRAR